jgi:hypothetical protein
MARALTRNIKKDPGISFSRTTAFSVRLCCVEMSYYVVQDVKTKKCTIMDQKPTTTEYTTVGDDGVVYKTRVEAENAMKTVKVCTTE